mmetsp:Transcript_4253/g.10111  ORF Transcript_4253/g.10111 Transcript_4253/m.10111 type:complete len:245 (-) Transcript_4253:66-800(-)
MCPTRAKLPRPRDGSSAAKSGRSLGGLLVLLHSELLEVEVELPTLKDVAVDAAGLAGPRGDARQEAAVAELVVQRLREHARLLPSRKLLLGFLVLHRVLLGPLLGELGDTLLLLLPNLRPVVVLVPVLERLSVDQDNGVFHQSLGAHQLVVGRVVHDILDLHLHGAHLCPPREVTRVEAHRAVLHVTPAAAHGVHALRANLGRCSRSAHLMLALLVQRHALATRRAPLVILSASNTHDESSLRW